MIPRPFSMDAQNRAQDLAVAILSASSRPTVAAASSAAASFLRRHSSDQPRAFFSAAFPALIRRLFGFDDPPSAPSWLSLAADDPTLASAIFDLLSPSGPLFSSISAVDRHSLIKYVFPIERLPEWMRFALQSDRHAPILSDICSLFKSRVKEDKILGCYQLQLNVFEYYVFWFAYYPVCRGITEGIDVADARKSRRFRLENWTSSLPGLGAGNRRSGQKTEGNLYLRLLYAYLRAFVPRFGLGSYQPYRSSLLHYSSTYDASAFLQAEFFVYTLIHFWMVDNDFSPLAVSMCRSFGISFPSWAVLSETPPTAGLGEVLNLVVKYLNCSLLATSDGDAHMELGGSPVWKASGSVDVGKRQSMMVSHDSFVCSWNILMQRPLYRFILRTFLFCPIGTSIKNTAQVCSVWVTYMTPWRTTPEDFAEFETPGIQKSESAKKESIQSQRGSLEEAVYTPVWQGYVLSNYLFYSALVVHFLGFAHKFLHANVDMVIQIVLKVLDILTSSRELICLLQKVDAAYHSKPAGPSSLSGSVYKYIPLIREQLQDWEDGLFESCTDGSFLRENLNQDLRLFSHGEDGAQNLLQLFVLRAEHEIQGISRDISQNLHALESIRDKMSILIGDHVRQSPSPVVSDAHLLTGRSETFTPKHPGVGKGTWADVQYKGDWMKRPISDTEVAWLARLLVKLSAWLNDALGLDQSQESEESDSPGPAIVEVNCCETISVREPKEAMRMAMTYIVSGVALFGQTMLRFMRAHKMRINLRVFASKKFITVLLVYVASSALMKVFKQGLQSWFL